MYVCVCVCVCFQQGFSVALTVLELRLPLNFQRFTCLWLSLCSAHYFFLICRRG